MEELEGGGTGGPGVPGVGGWRGCAPNSLPQAPPAPPPPFRFLCIWFESEEIRLSGAGLEKASLSVCFTFSLGAIRSLVQPLQPLQPLQPS